MRRSRAELRSGPRLAAAAAAIVIIGAPAAAQDARPAVSEPNVKASLNLGHAQVTGHRASGFAWYAEGAFTLPVGRLFGVQLEGMMGTLDGRYFRGAAAHAFWRDPDLALLGGTFQYQGMAGGDVLRFGGEAEYYRGRFTLAANVGYQTGDPNKSKTIRPGQGAYGLFDVRYYAWDDLMLRAGGGFAPLRKGRYEGSSGSAPSISPVSRPRPV